MKKRIAAGCWLLMLCLAASAQDRPVKPPFRASLHADCALGPSPTGFWVRVDRVSATHTRIVFKSQDAKKPAATFVVPGILVAFQYMRNDLVLNFEPGPTTRAYSEIGGKVRQIFECTSRFGAESVPIETMYGATLVCFQGAQMVGRLWLPTVAKIYVRGEKSYDLAAEVPYRSLFQALGEIHNRVTRKLSGGAWGE